MMYESKKSDSPIVVVKRTNNGTAVPAEPVERRGETKGNLDSRNTCRTQSWESVSHGAERVRQAAKRNRKEPLTVLLHHITVEALEVAYFSLKAKAATGADGVSWLEYGEGLEARLRDLHARVHTGAFRAMPVRRVNILKPDGGPRPLGIAAFEDKIVQKAMVVCILSPIYETEFLGFSYGFRPERGAHDALDALGYAVSRKKVNWIVDADIKAFFDRIDRDQLIRFVEHRIGDRRVVRLIRKWLDAGVMENGHWKDEGMGTPQGRWSHRCWRTCIYTMPSTSGLTGNGASMWRPGTRSSSATRITSWSDSNARGMRAGFCKTWESGSASSKA